VEADDVHPPWPSWSSGPGLNELSDGGNTPTGLSEFDLNTPEGNATLYGRYPVNRLVRGLKGNAAWLVTNVAATTVRDGILMHTGNWTATGVPWTPGTPMPNSLGCIHAYPDSIAGLAALLQGGGVGAVARPNTDGALPYPYAPQGLLSIEQVD
jgi:hypothetical protein